MDIQYKIIGGDNEEYGPATLAEIKSWIQDGRVAAMTKVWRSDLAAWAAADRYTELLEDLGRLHATANSSVDRSLAPAGFWSRLAAYLVDGMIVTCLFFLLANIFGWLGKFPVPIAPKVLDETSFHTFLTAMADWTWQTLPYYAPIFLIYDVLLNGTFGATLGKMAIGAKIVQPDGSPIGYTRALLRWLAARLVEIFYFVGYLSIFFRADKRGLHDLMAGTKVVYKR